MILNVKTADEVGYLLVNMLRFWHSVVDYTSFGFLPIITLLLRVWVPFWLLASGVSGW